MKGSELEVDRAILDGMKGGGIGYAMGIDEAGRGPVLGPMVYGGFWCPLGDKMLKGSGYDDSKKLSEKEREKLFAQVKESGHGWKCIVLQASELSNKMLRKSKYNLNLISHEAAMDLIQFVLDAGVALEEVYVDTVGKKETYQAKLQERFPALSITVDTKADSKYPVVSAASICAKVTRDALLRDWAFEEQGINPTTNFGSGYPGDPTTKKWLKGNMDPVFGFPSLIRFSWKTTTTSLEDQGALTVWYGDEEEEEQRKEKKLPPVQFVYRQGKRARYFSDREMDVANDF